ncbi:MAG TPA: vWA domain-containing protein, partial [Haliangium sp.]|nr:vWA domain-containing protein [Haliangium sp.]
GLERLWARHRIDAALERLAREPGQASEIQREVLALALAHSLMSPYTSLVAEDSEVVSKGAPRRVDVAAPLPAGPSDGEDAADLDSETDGFTTAAGSVRAEAAAVVPAGMRAKAAFAPPAPGAPPPAPAPAAAPAPARATVPGGPGGLARTAAAPPPPAPMAPAPMSLAAYESAALSEPMEDMDDLSDDEPDGAVMSSYAAPGAFSADRARGAAAAAPAAAKRGGGLLGAVGGLVRRVLGADGPGGPDHGAGEEGEVAEAAGAHASEAPTAAPGSSPDPKSRATVLGRPRPSQIPIEPPGSDPYDVGELRWLSSRASGELDLVFLVDETGSMGPYIEQVKEHLLALVAALRGSPLCKSLRLGLVTYRDHPPQDSTYASRAVALTDDIAAIRRAVSGMQASGGGDGPESVTDGLFDVVRLDWRPRATRAVVWFGDAPPHGVEPHGDSFPQGCPCGHHWYTQAESCREMGIGIYAVGCLPGLGQYAGAVDVFRTVAQTTGGAYLPLTQADRLVPLIAGAAATELDKQRIDEHLAEIVAAHAEDLRRTDEAERIRWLTETMRAQGVRPRGMDYRAEDAAPAPLRFRAIEPEDVASALDRLRLGGRAAT